MNRQTFSRAFDKAPRDRQLNMLVPTGNPAEPLSREIAWWDGALGRWEGDWRYDDTDGNWATAEPIAWAPLVEIDQATLKEFADMAAAAVAAKARKALPPPTKPEAKADKRPAQGRKNVDMTTGKPIILKTRATKHPETFEAA